MTAQQNETPSDTREDILRHAREFAAIQGNEGAAEQDMLHAYAESLRDELLGDTGYLPEGEDRESILGTLEAANEMLGADAPDMTAVTEQGFAPAEIREQDKRDHPHDEDCPKCGRRQWGETDNETEDICQACGYVMTDDDV
jgi:hypothetical protein